MYGLKSREIAPESENPVPKVALTAEPSNPNPYRSSFATHLTACGPVIREPKVLRAHARSRWGGTWVTQSPEYREEGMSEETSAPKFPNPMTPTLQLDKPNPISLTQVEV